MAKNPIRNGKVSNKKRKSILAPCELKYNCIRERYKTKQFLAVFSGLYP